MTPTSSSISRNENTHRVRKGDNLTHIAKNNGLALPDLLKANPQIKDPNQIVPGQEITLPNQNRENAARSAARAEPETASSDRSASTGQPTSAYEIQSGDTLTGIARAHGVSARAIQQHNPAITNPNQIQVGGTLQIPHSQRQPRTEAPGPTSVLSAETRYPGLFGEGAQINPVLQRGSTGSHVQNVQEKLSKLGYNPGPADGQFGGQTFESVRHFQRMNNLSPDGTVGAKTWQALNSDSPSGPRTLQTGNGGAPQLNRYEPFSPEAKALFSEAAAVAGVPASWANSSGLHNILRRESNGKVGVPNYTYGARARDPSRWAEVHNELKDGRITARSSATGLGQLLLNNVERYYPNGRAGIGNPVEEAAGMLSYIKDRYGNPDNAWRLYGTRHEGY
jgi:LysM repeat protein